MAFSSSVFAVFLLTVYACYVLLIKHHKLQNYLLLLASFVFYGWWDWRFTFLLFGSTLISFVCAQRISAFPSQKKLWLIISIFTNIGALAFFKYFNFFQENLIELLALLGFERFDPALNVLLPVGISFFTFQNMSYVIDVFRKEYPPEHDFIAYALYVSFFPQLVAGPIERADHMLPQYKEKRNLNPQQTLDGIVLITWGLFKKVVIADHLATFVDPVFNDYTEYSGFSLTFATLAFTFQIYCDFSAYSDIARGVAKIFGLELMLNFRLPYLATSPREFWRRWHISLSTWIRDYIYKPLGGNRGSNWFIVRNLMITMLLGGLWHGAAWNFVLWGGYHGLLLSIQHLFERIKRRVAPTQITSSSAKIILIPIQIGSMFILTMIGWVLFRGDSLDQIYHFFSQFGFSNYSSYKLDLEALVLFILLIILVDGFLIRNVETKGAELVRPHFAAISVSVFVLIMMIYAVRTPTEFIYFQF